MGKKVAILRGINVGGKRKILMADLKDLFADAGFTNCSTYIQSGNVLFTAANDLSETEISKKISAAILAKYGFDVPVIVRSANELKAAIKNNPFYTGDEAELNQLHLTFLNTAPEQKAIKTAESVDSGEDKFVVANCDIYVFCQGKYHQSKLSNTFFENKLKVTATTRNWKTVLKLCELAN
ncbi:DUF1697 domain-containing protein [uncultured Draconibacterium sp.]|uniref:DUF1697 domain-containing protein n=1 Tax=uncultured Draconibacterium sp. TaxID=1573823 RepID=UPI0032177A1B